MRINTLADWCFLLLGFVLIAAGLTALAVLIWIEGWTVNAAVWSIVVSALTLVPGVLLALLGRRVLL